MWMDNAQPYYTADYQGNDANDWANYNSWWAGQAPEPQQETRTEGPRRPNCIRRVLNTASMLGRVRKDKETPTMVVWPLPRMNIQLTLCPILSNIALLQKMKYQIDIRLRIISAFQLRNV